MAIVTYEERKEQIVFFLAAGSPAKSAAAWLSAVERAEREGRPCPDWAELEKLGSSLPTKPLGDKVNLVRLGHYFVPTNTAADVQEGHPIEGSCRTALVVHVIGEEPDVVVNLAVWNSNGGQEVRSSIPVEAPATGHDSFHLSADCPWLR